MRKWKLEERKRLTHQCTSMESEFSQTTYLFLMVVFAVQCKWKPNYFRTRFRASEKRQLLTGSVPGGKPVLLTFHCWELNCDSSGGLRAWVPEAKYGKKLSRASGDSNQPGPPKLSQWHFAHQRVVSSCSWAKRIGLSRLPAGTSCSCGFWGLGLLPLLNCSLFLWL